MYCQVENLILFPKPETVPGWPNVDKEPADSGQHNADGTKTIGPALGIGHNYFAIQTTKVSSSSP
jgi:hypothetical protein